MTRPSIAELLPIAQPGQVLLVRRRGFLGWLIRRVTRSEYSHSALIDRTESGVVVTVEAADLAGVKALRLNAHLEDPGVTGLLLRDAALTPSERAAVMKAAWLRVGRGYDTLQLLSIYVRHRLPWLFGGRRALEANRLDQADRLICSELVTIAYQEGAGLSLAPEGVVTGNVDPGMLAVAPTLVDVWRWPA